MTEYDYSPEAYEKYLANQARIARWVDDTKRTRLVAPDVPPTPLGMVENAPLPRKKDRKYRSSRPSSPIPEEPMISSRRNRSKSMSVPRPPTPFEHAKKELPKVFVPSPEVPAPGCPIYHYTWSPKPHKAPSPSSSPSPPPEPTYKTIKRERRRSSAPTTRRNSPQDPMPFKELPDPAYASYFPGLDSGDVYAPAPDRVKPHHLEARERSMSFSAAASRPLDHSPPTLQHYYSDSPQPSSTNRGHSSYYSSQNSSPHYPSTSAPFVPPPPIRSAPAPAPGQAYPKKNYSYPLPHQQYSDYDAVRRRELSRSHTAPAHAPRHSIDSAPYVHDAPGYSHERARPVELAYQHHQHTRVPSPSPITTERQPNSIPVTFPNGKTLYVNPPNADRSEILKHPDLYQVPYDYYKSPNHKEAKKPLLQRLFTGLGRGGSSNKSSGSRSGPSSPTQRHLRRRRSSFG